jgi:hypothetical protein
VKRAKQTLNYLIGYLICSEQCHERFEIEWNDLNAENREKIQLHGEIEDLKNEISEKVIKLQADKDAKPQVSHFFYQFNISNNNCVISCGYSTRRILWNWRSKL